MMLNKGQVITSTGNLSQILLASILTIAVWVFTAQAAPLQAPIVGEVQFLSVQNASEVYSRGTMVVGGQNIIIPANLLIDLPANRLTLQQIFAQAPPNCLALGESGLAKGDLCNTLAHGASVSILANVSSGGDVIAGEIFMPKAGEIGLGAGENINGNVTYINYTDGYLRVNGIPGDQATGAMVRINDPEGRHTVQQGLGCAAGSLNCSPDVRYGLDPDNYTITFTTGYPACIPSTLTGVGNRTVASDGNGVGDPLCPSTNRGTPNNVVQNSAFFAPIQLGDHIAAEGNFEIVNGVQFLSAHTLTVDVGLLTVPGQPDYITWDEVEWDAPGFQNQRIRTLFIGFTTLSGDNVDIFALHVDPTDNSNHEFPLASTAGCEAIGGAGSCLNQGLGGGAPNIFKVRYDVDFIATGNKPELYPCQILEAGGFPGSCPSGATFDTAQNFNILSPISRELIGRSRNKQGAYNGGIPIGDSQDILGNAAPNGEYLTPVGIGHPEFVEINLNAVQTPLIFEGEPWNLDRRLGPGGCGNVPGDCDTQVALDPFPYSGLDPAGEASGFPLASVNEPRAFFPFGPGEVLPLSLATAPPAQGIVPTPVVDLAALSTVTVPDVGGQLQADAGLSIINIGLTVGSVSLINSATVPVDTVISQNPKSAISVAPGTAVDLVVSSGPNQTGVPDVGGLVQSAAEADIINAGLTVGIINFASSPTIVAGNVISQNPLAGELAAPGSAVDLIISSGNDPPATSSTWIWNATSSTSGNFNVVWGASPTPGAIYVLEQATDAAFTNAAPVYTGPNTVFSTTGMPNGTYYYRVKTTAPGFSDSAWTENATGIVVALLAQSPGWIWNATTSTSGNYNVVWGSSPTPGAAYILEQATDAAFSDAAPVYAGPNTGFSLTGMTSGTYFYRVKTTATGYADSNWRENATGIVVTLP